MRSVGSFLALGAILPVLGVQADTQTAQMRVSAVVVAHARLDAVDTELPLVVTDRDLARGYVDVVRRYRLQTNAPDQVSLQLQPRVGLARTIDVAGFAGPVRLVADDLEVSPPSARDFELSFRVWLDPAVPAGEYPLPLNVAAVVR